MRKIFFMAYLLCYSALSMASLDDIKIIKNNEKLNTILITLISSGELETSNHLGEAICKAGGASYCSGL